MYKDVGRNITHGPRPERIRTEMSANDGNVRRMIEINNPDPWMTFGGMGSKKLFGSNIEYITNNDSHPGAQFNPEFRSLVKTEIAKLFENELRAENDLEAEGDAAHVRHCIRFSSSCVNYLFRFCVKPPGDVITFCRYDGGFRWESTEQVELARHLFSSSNMRVQRITKH
jgi:hypothetical protein